MIYNSISTEGSVSAGRNYSRSWWRTDVARYAGVVCRSRLYKQSYLMTVYCLGYYMLCKLKPCWSGERHSFTKQTLNYLQWSSLRRCVLLQIKAMCVFVSFAWQCLSTNTIRETVILKEESALPVYLCFKGKFSLTPCMTVELFKVPFRSSKREC